MIQTHNAKACTMLLDCTLPPSMWAEAISTVNYFHARSLTSSNNGMTPYEKLFGGKPRVSHLRHFGCKAFKSLPAYHRSKFGTHAHPLFMLGYVHDSTTIWRFWDPHRRQVMRASNVTFLESVELGLGASSEPNSSSKLNSSGRLGLDASAVGLGLGTSSELNSSDELNSSGRLGLDALAVGLRLGASSELNSSGRLGLDASAVGLRIGASSKLNSSGELNSSGGLGLDDSAVRCGLGASSELNSSRGLGLDTSAVGLGLSVWNGRLGNLEGNTGQYDLRKRPRAVTHRIQVE